MTVCTFTEYVGEYVDYSEIACTVRAGALCECLVDCCFENVNTLRTLRDTLLYENRCTTYIRAFAHKHDIPSAYNITHIHEKMNARKHTRLSTWSVVCSLESTASRPKSSPMNHRSRLLIPSHPPT